MSVSEATRELQAQLAAAPRNDALREKVAHALHAEGAPAEALEVLSTLINMTAHDEEHLPCLCRAHLDARVLEASASDVKFRRTFTVAAGRVLHFWIPDDVARDEAEIVESVQIGLAQRAGKRRNQVKKPW